NVPYREGVFATWNDPAKFGLFYHAALLFRRKDVDSAKETVAIEVDDMKLTPSDIPNLGLITEKHKVRLHFKASTEGTYDRKIRWDEKIVEENEGKVVSDTGQLQRDWIKKVGIIDSKRTKIVYGFLGDKGKILLNGLEIKVSNPFAVVAISSLTSDAIEDSNNLLLTAVGRVRNTGMEFNFEGEYAELINLGQLPVQVEVIEVEISIKTNTPNLKVWAISSEGFYIGAIPSTYEEGMLRFKIGESFCSIYYLIQAE
ncbi:MAG: hypothetical protein ACP5RW_10060, partial [bacterium]